MSVRASLVATVACATVGALPAVAQDDPRLTRLKPLLELEGCWRLEASEANTMGDSFKQSGSVVIPPALDGRALRFEEFLTVTEAKGRYERLPKERLFIEYWSFDPSTSLFQIVSVEPDASTAKLAPSADGKAFYRSSMFFSNSLQMPLELREVTRIESDDQIVTTAEIKGVFQNYSETYTEVMTREDRALEDCRQ